jgi:hypothetical protein
VFNFFPKPYKENTVIGEDGSDDDSIVEKTTVMTRIATLTEEKTGLKRCFGTFISFLI